MFLSNINRTDHRRSIPRIIPTTKRGDLKMESSPVQLAVHNRTKKVVRVRFLTNVLGTEVVKVYTGSGDKHSTMIKKMFERHYTVTD